MNSIMFSLQILPNEMFLLIWGDAQIDDGLSIYSFILSFFCSPPKKQVKQGYPRKLFLGELLRGQCGHFEKEALHLCVNSPPYATHHSHIMA